MTKSSPRGGRSRVGVPAEGQVGPGRGPVWGEGPDRAPVRAEGRIGVLCGRRGGFCLGWRGGVGRVVSGRPVLTCPAEGQVLSCPARRDGSSPVRRGGVGLARSGSCHVLSCPVRRARSCPVRDGGAGGGASPILSGAEGWSCPVWREGLSGPVRGEAVRSGGTCAWCIR